MLCDQECIGSDWREASEAVYPAGSHAYGINHCISGDGYDVLKALNINAVGAYQSPDDYAENQELLKAARDGDTKLLCQAMSSGADLESRNHCVSFSSRVSGGHKPVCIPVGLTPLMHAAHEGHSACVRLLVMARASVCAEDEDGMSPLHFAASAASLDVAAALMWAGAHPGALDKSGVGVMGHLPEAVYQDSKEIQRWRATFDSIKMVDSGTASPDKFAASSSPDSSRVNEAEPTSKSSDIVERDMQHGVGGSAAWLDDPVEAMDPCDYTGSVLQSIG
jgi:hypothetical protein